MKKTPKKDVIKKAIAISKSNLEDNKSCYILDKIYLVINLDIESSDKVDIIHKLICDYDYDYGYDIDKIKKQFMDMTFIA
jgi:hypothetical protein